MLGSMFGAMGGAVSPMMGGGAGGGNLRQMTSKMNMKPPNMQRPMPQQGGAVGGAMQPWMNRGQPKGLGPSMGGGGNMPLQGSAMGNQMMDVYNRGNRGGTPPQLGPPQSEEDRFISQYNRGPVSQNMVQRYQDIMSRRQGGGQPVGLGGGPPTGLGPSNFGPPGQTPNGGAATPPQVISQGGGGGNVADVFNQMNTGLQNAPGQQTGQIPQDAMDMMNRIKQMPQGGGGGGRMHDMQYRGTPQQQQQNQQDAWNRFQNPQGGGGLGPRFPMGGFR